MSGTFSSPESKQPSGGILPWERGILPTPNMDDTEGFQCLGQSNWIICSPLSQSCPQKFPTFSLSYWGAHSYYPRGPIMRKGNSSNFQYGWDRGVSVPGAFKLDHWQPFKPILFWNFSTFSLSYWGAHSYYPRGLIMGKGKFLQLPIWIRLRSFSAWGIQTGPLAAL